MDMIFGLASNTPIDGAGADIKVRRPMTAVMSPPVAASMAGVLLMTDFLSTMICTFSIDWGMMYLELIQSQCVP
jgi:hypothetical protein